MQMPKPDASVLVRRMEIAEALRAIVPGEGVIDDSRTSCGSTKATR